MADQADWAAELNKGTVGRVRRVPAPTPVGSETAEEAASRALRVQQALNAMKFPPLSSVEALPQHLELLESMLTAIPAPDNGGVLAARHVLLVLRGQCGLAGVIDSIIPRNYDWEAMVKALLGKTQSPIVSSESILRVLNLAQSPDEDIDTYIRRFQSLLGSSGVNLEEAWETVANIPTNGSLGRTKTAILQQAVFALFAFCRGIFVRGLAQDYLRRDMVRENPAGLAAMLQYARVRSVNIPKAGAASGDGRQDGGRQHQKGRGGGRSKSATPGPSSSGESGNKDKKPSGTASASSSSPPKDAEKKDVVCAHCKKKGHVIEQCFKLHPELKQKKVDGHALGVESSSSPMSLVDEPFYYPCTVNGNLNLCALVDTGSGLNAFSKDVVERYKLDAFKGPYLSGVSWTGVSLSSDTYVRVRIQAGMLDVAAELPVMTTPPGYDLVLGRAFGRQHHLTYDMTTNQVHCMRGLAFTPKKRSSTAPLVAFLEVVSPVVDDLVLDPSPPIDEQYAAVFDMHLFEGSTSVAPGSSLDSFAPPSERAAVAAALRAEFPSVFGLKLTKLPPLRAVNLKVKLKPGAVIKPQPVYRLNSHEHDALFTKISDMESYGGVYAVSNVAAVPTFLVPKRTSDGSTSYRVVTDWRLRNQLVEPDRFPTPTPLELIALVQAKAYLMAKIDLVDAFHQIRVDPECEQFFTISTPFGSFAMRVAPMGFTNSPAALCQALYEIFKDFMAESWLLIYFDDILILSESWSSHVDHLRRFFDRCLEAQLVVHSEKSHFFLTEVDFVGHHISSAGVRPIADRVLAIVDFPTPTSKTSVRSFLGAANFYRDYVRNFADLAAPLYELTSPKSGFLWSQRHQVAFESLKKALVSAPCLVVPDLSGTPVFCGPY